MTTTNTPAATDTAPAYRRDRYGFPVIDCPRCLGRGRVHGFSHVRNGVCFKCEGAGFTYPTGKPGTLAAEFHNAVRAARSVSAAAYWNAETREITCGLAVGDDIRPRVGDRQDPGPWRTIAAVKVTRKIVGESRRGVDANSGDMILRAFTLATRVTYTDGETVELWGISMQRRADTNALIALRDRLAAEARTAYETTLARRAARSARAARQ